MPQIELFCYFCKGSQTLIQIRVKETEGFELGYPQLGHKRNWGMELHNPASSIQPIVLSIYILSCLGMYSNIVRMLVKLV